MLGWGRRPSGLRAVSLAEKACSSFLLLEDGFLRSVGRNDPSLSFAIDHEGMYYDAAAPSSLERMIAQPLTDDECSRALSIVSRWRALRLSKYNGDAEFGGELPERYVLVVDQVAKDASVGFGLGSPDSFTNMLDAALAENALSTIVVKVHPDTLSGTKAGYFDMAALKANPRVRIIADRCHVARLIENAEKIYTVTSQVGFEGLLWGKPVRCFGMPFYAGWGLTDDVLPAPSRRTRVSLEQLVFAALVRYPRYVDPENGFKPCEAEVVMDYIGLQRHMWRRFPETVHVVGLPLLQRPLFRQLLAGSSVVFVRSLHMVPMGGAALIWGREQLDVAEERIKLIGVTEGFLRTVPPRESISLIAGSLADPDRTASRPFALDWLLDNARLDDSLRQRARGLMDKINAGHVDHRKTGPERWARPPGYGCVLLVPGHGEDVGRKTVPAKRDLRLLQEVRQANPDAFILFAVPSDKEVALLKKHATVTALCDEIICRTGVADLLDQVDEVHTSTSLVGFEALLRNLEVVCYEQSFYSGWGLTRDVVPVDRGGRKLTIEELVAAALILYPAYINLKAGCFISPEKALAQGARLRDGPASLPAMGRDIRAVFRACVALGRESGLFSR